MTNASREVSGANGHPSKTTLRSSSLPPLRSKQAPAVDLPKPLSTHRRAVPPPPPPVPPSKASRTEISPATSSQPPSKLPPARVKSWHAAPSEVAPCVASSLEDWKKRHGHATNTKVFSIHGVFPGIRQALLNRGWVENEDEASPYWDLKYALMQRDIGDVEALDDKQVVNFYGRCSEIAAKVGLCNNLYNCSQFESGVDVDSFLPRCYDLTNPGQVEGLVHDFKATKCLCIVRRFAQDGGHCKEANLGMPAFPRAIVRLALEVCTRRCRSFDDALDEPVGPLVTDEEWDQIEAFSLKKPGQKVKPPHKRRSQSQPAADVDNEGAQPVHLDDDVELAPDPGHGDLCHREASLEQSRCHEDELLYQAATQVLADDFWKHPQRGLDGTQNIWMLKPAGKSRGRGIQLTALLSKIHQVGVGRGAEARWIAQKYMENPLIIGNKKFDMRQWVIVTQWNPLSVWFYEDCYLRFSFADYDPARLKNKFAHLTNNSVSKHAKEFEDQRDDTMWHSSSFQEYLRSLPSSESSSGQTTAGDPWLSKIQPKMKEIVLRSLESVQDVMQARPNSFQLFGYDFMVSDDLETWLIEVNSSPDLSYSTSTTKLLVKRMLEDLVKVVIDAERFGSSLSRPRRKWDKLKLDTGRFTLLQAARRRREEKFGKVRAEAHSLALHGDAIKLSKVPKSGMPKYKGNLPVVDAAQVMSQKLPEADSNVQRRTSHSQSEPLSGESDEELDEEPTEG
mmetsp:Transcript_55383/g.124471  ORF Transcript_55383/g.124471 Transcript_55383/m.124471 type:complete len:734 (-) Transcript_55383:8-2209(-)